MKKLLLLLLFALPAILTGQIIKGTGISYFDSIPNVAPPLPKGTEIALGIKTKKLYRWDRTCSCWIELETSTDSLARTVLASGLFNEYAVPFGGSTGKLDQSAAFQFVLGQLQANSFATLGSAGAGYLGLSPQSSVPATPASGIRVYADASGRFGWIGTNGYTRVFDASGITANRTFKLQNKTYTLADSTDVASLSTSLPSTYFPLAGGAITGTGGAGFVGFPAQSSNPSTPGGGFRIFANGAGNMGVIRADGYVTTFDFSTATGNRFFTYPANAGTFGILENTQSWTGINTFTPTGTGAAGFIYSSTGRPSHPFGTVTTAQMNAMTGMAAGDGVYNATTKRLNIWDVSWLSVPTMTTGGIGNTQVVIGDASGNIGGSSQFTFDNSTATSPILAIKGNTGNAGTVSLYMGNSVNANSPSFRAPAFGANGYANLDVYSHAALYVRLVNVNLGSTDVFSKLQMDGAQTVITGVTGNTGNRALYFNAGNYSGTLGNSAVMATPEGSFGKISGIGLSINNAPNGSAYADATTSTFAIYAKVNRFVGINNANPLSSFHITPSYSSTGDLSGVGYGFQLAAATYNNATTVAGGSVLGLNTLVGGSGYLNGTYTGIALTGGAGSGATANITVSGGVVTVATINAPGLGYVVGNVLSAANTIIGGGSGSGFSITVSSLGTNVVANGAVASIGRPTITATNAGVIYTNFSTLTVHQPVASTNVTITNPWAFRVFSGNSLFAGFIRVNDSITDAFQFVKTGTGVHSIGPTFASPNTGPGLSFRKGGAEFMRIMENSVLLLTSQIASITLNNHTWTRVGDAEMTLGLAGGGSAFNGVFNFYTRQSNAASNTLRIGADANNNSEIKTSMTYSPNTSSIEFRTMIGGVIGERARFANTTGNLLVGTTTDVPSSIFTINSTTQGFLIPRGTDAQIAAIPSPVLALQSFSTTSERINVKRTDGFYQVAYTQDIKRDTFYRTTNANLDLSGLTSTIAARYKRVIVETIVTVAATGNNTITMPVPTAALLGTKFEISVEDTSGDGDISVLSFGTDGTDGYLYNGDGTFASSQNLYPGLGVYVSVSWCQAKSAYRWKLQ